VLLVLASTFTPLFAEVHVKFTKSLRKVACLDLGGLRIVSDPTFDAPARTAT
jgi:hypothetical protein